MSVLKIDSSARLLDSNSRTISHYLAEQLVEQLVEQLDTHVVSRDLVKQPLPLINAADMINLHASNDSDSATFAQHLTLSNTLIQELMDTDTLVLAAPMYNFGIPAVLKQWIDYVCRAGLTFKYGEQGPVGLTNIKRAFIITASGGAPVGSSMDFVSPYLAQICNFIGVQEIIQIDASGSKGDPQTIIADAKVQIDEALSNFNSEVVAGA
jgi:FMN-dependent NADH-azoreductase